MRAGTTVKYNVDTPCQLGRLSYNQSMEVASLLPARTIDSLENDKCENLGESATVLCKQY